MDQRPGSELPPIQDTEVAQSMPLQFAEAQPGLYANEQASGQAIETAQSQGVGPVPTTNPLVAPSGAQQAAPQPMPVSQSGFPGMPAMADDTDLIEKEWVMKAKEIVARTRHDPYQQNKQVESFKADYMKKRYNKDIKLTED